MIDNSDEVKSGSKMKICLERARTGNIRTTLRVQVEGDTVRRLWAEVRENENVNHDEIVEKIATAVRAGVVTCKEEALALKSKLMQGVEAFEDAKET